MKTFLVLILSALLSLSCTVPTSNLLTPQQAVDSKEPPEAEILATIELRLRHYRQTLVALIQTDQIDKDEAKTLMDLMRAVDYYVCKGWAAMVEGDVATRDAATIYAEYGLEIISGKLLTILRPITGKQV